MQTEASKLPLLVLEQVSKFAKGVLSLGQLAKLLDKSISDTAILLASLGIPVLDYELADELDTLANLIPNNL